jgi:hypothetical protein
MNKPTSFLRHIGKPDYIHIVANQESWLFLTKGEAEKVWSKAREVGYELVAGDISGGPTPQEVKEYLEQALCREEAPLNTRRKITHSRGLFARTVKNNEDNESKQKDDRIEDSEPMNRKSGDKPLAWNSRVFMKPIEEVAKELEKEGWCVFWKSEVEAIAIRENGSANQNLDIVEFMENLGIKLKKTGKEYTGLCPFHDDHEPSLSINREKRLWHCFGCGKSGDIQRFIQEWQKRRDTQ